MTNGVLEPRPAEPMAPAQWWKICVDLLHRAPKSFAVIAALGIALQYGFILLASGGGPLNLLASTILGMVGGMAFHLFALRWWTVLDRAVATDRPVTHVFACWRSIALAAVGCLGFVFASMVVMNVMGVDNVVSSVFPHIESSTRRMPSDVVGDLVHTAAFVLVSTPLFLCVNTAFFFDIPWIQARKLRLRYEASRSLRAGFVHDGLWFGSWMLGYWLWQWIAALLDLPTFVMFLVQGMAMAVGSAWTYVAVRDIFLGRRENRPMAVWQARPEPSAAEAAG